MKGYDSIQNSDLLVLYINSILYRLDSENMGWRIVSLHVAFCAAALVCMAITDERAALLSYI